MKHAITILSSIALLGVLAPAVAHASPRVAVAPASGINVHEGYLEAASDVFAGHLRSNGFFAFTTDGAGGKREMSGGEAVALGRANQAELVAVLHVTRLGSSATIRLAVYNATDSTMVHSDQLAAGSPDDLDKVLARLANGFATGKPARGNAELETVTDKEARPLTKIAATHSWGLKLGMVAPVETVGDTPNPIPGMSIFWLYDMRNFLAEVEIGFHDQNNRGDLFIGLGGYYPFSRGNTTPYAGGTLRYIGTSYGEDSSGGGLQLAGGLGFLIGRLSTVQVRVEAQYFINTFAENGYTYYADTGSNEESVNSHGLAFNLGISF